LKRTVVFSKERVYFLKSTEIFLILKPPNK